VADAAAMGEGRGGLVVGGGLPDGADGQQIALAVIEVGGQLPAYLGQR
jgi:hypothetical protein